MSGTGGLEVGCWSCDGGEFSSAEGAGGLGAGCGGEMGGERHPSSCGICLLLARTAARLLDRVASLTVFARLRGGGAGCGDGAAVAPAMAMPAVANCGAAEVARPAMAKPAAAAWVELLATAGYWLMGWLDWR